jgi:Molecular chaperone GrpE (heat shock protein)|nr:nucleotide exchange factor GrpE [uncultured Azohydromonas sp.]
MNHTDNTTTPEAAAVPPAADTPSAAAAAEATAAYAAHSAPASHGAAEEGAAAPSLEQRLSELEARHAEVSDAYLRAKAETENVRRRSEEEVAKARKFAVEAFAESLLPVKDSLEAAIATPNATAEQVLEGVQVTLRQLSQALERNKVVEVAPPAGTRFDPHQHQAISMVPADQEANTVVTVLQKGYLIAERVLRPALVTVAAPK